jgi:hypothetical protein
VNGGQPQAEPTPDLGRREGGGGRGGRLPRAAPCTGPRAGEPPPGAGRVQKGGAARTFEPGGENNQHQITGNEDSNITRRRPAAERKQPGGQRPAGNPKRSGPPDLGRREGRGARGRRLPRAAPCTGPRRGEPPPGAVRLEKGGGKVRGNRGGAQATATRRARSRRRVREEGGEKGGDGCEKRKADAANRTRASGAVIMRADESVDQHGFERISVDQRGSERPATAREQPEPSTYSIERT